MKKLYTICVLIGLLAGQLCHGQTSLAEWNFDASTTAPSFTIGNLNANAVAIGSGNSLPGGAIGPFQANGGGKLYAVSEWRVTDVSPDRYIDATISPASNYSLTLESFSFDIASSSVNAMGNTGPTMFVVRSNRDGYSSNLLGPTGLSTTLTNYSVSLAGLFTNYTGSVSLRIFAYGATTANSSSTVKVDNMKFSGMAPLPVTLLSFTAKPEGDRVQLAWATTMERDADRFVVERSRDLTEYVAVGEVPAKGTTDQRQNYGLTDLNPQPGANYYRLKQIDFNGTAYYFKAVSAIVRVDEPTVAVYPNPADANRIHLRLWNADDATIRLLNTTGQTVGGQLDRLPGEADFRPAQLLPTGLYRLEVITNGQRRVLNVLVR